MAEVLQDIVNEPRLTLSRLRLALQSESGMSMVWVIVEGSFDSVVFRKLLSISSVSVNIGVKENMISGGYAVVENIVSEVNKEIPNANVCGVRDKDFLQFLDPPHSLPENVFLTDRSDLEMTLVECESVKETLRQKIPGYLRAETTMLPILRQLGYERVYCGCKHLRIHSDNIRKVSKIWDYQTQSLFEDWKTGCIEMFEKESGYSGMDVEAFVEEAGLKDESDYDIIRGHDYVKFISTALIDVARYSEDFISLTMSESYSPEDFRNSRLHGALVDWQNKRGVIVVRE